LLRLVDWEMNSFSLCTTGWWCWWGRLAGDRWRGWWWWRRRSRSFMEAITGGVEQGVKVAGVYAHVLEVIACSTWTWARPLLNMLFIADFLVLFVDLTVWRVFVHTAQRVHCLPRIVLGAADVVYRVSHLFVEHSFRRRSFNIRCSCIFNIVRTTIKIATWNHFILHYIWS